MKEKNPRVLLARLRKGDYAHPGDTEAIDVFLEKLASFQHPNFGHILDVGCGRGGTAEYVRQKLSPILINGIDIDDQAIKYARDSYPNIIFYNCNINEIEQIGEQRFDLIYFFSVLYALESSSQQEVFNKLAHIAKPGAIIAISDYVLLDEDKNTIFDFANKPMVPPSINNLNQWLSESGWEVIGEFDLFDKYQSWYNLFLQRLDESKDSLLLDFEPETIDAVKNTFETILNKINSRIWSGNLLYAQFKKQTFFQDEPIEDKRQNEIVQPCILVKPSTT